MKSISTLDWPAIAAGLHRKGFAHIPGLLSVEKCQALIGQYPDASLYRNVIDMKRYRFGNGEYKYFNYPLPPLVQQLRNGLYSPLSDVANEWMKWLSLPEVFPPSHQELLMKCQVGKQERPTPLILRYEAGGHNTLHQDLYGQVWFPFQVVIVLTQHGVDHEGGEFVMTEQVPRAQSKVQVLQPGQGDGVIFTTNFRPVQGTRGYYRATMKHGVSEVTSGERYALGIIFHDAN